MSEMRAQMKVSITTMWAFHNLIAHPVCSVLRAFGLKRAGRWLHDVTVPPSIQEVRSQALREASEIAARHSSRAAEDIRAAMHHGDRPKHGEDINGEDTMSDKRNPWGEVAFLGTPPAPHYSETVLERMKRHPPPYRAEYAGKGDEQECPWIVVGSPQWNMLGVLLSKADASWCASVLNRAHGYGPAKTRDDQDAERKG